MDNDKLIDLFQFTGIEFGDFAASSLDEAKLVVFGVPMNLTSTFEGNSEEGPAAIRKVSSELIETYLLDADVDLADFVLSHDLGDFPIPPDKDAALAALAAYLPDTIKTIRGAGKIPLCLGGEHTISYYLLKGIAGEKPVVVHFDAHEDFKPEYHGEKICHTTPFYHATEFIPGTDMIQVGIRQTDPEEIRLARHAGVTIFTAWDVHTDITRVIESIHEKTRGRPVYVSLDIDVLDAPFTPATGTPVAFGLTPREVLKILLAMEGSIIGMDCMEVGRDPNYREAEVATQLLFRLISKIYGFPPKMV